MYCNVSALFNFSFIYLLYIIPSYGAPHQKIAIYWSYEIKHLLCKEEHRYEQRYVGKEGILPKIKKIKGWERERADSHIFGYQGCRPTAQAPCRRNTLRVLSPSSASCLTLQASPFSSHILFHSVEEPIFAEEIVTFNLPDGSKYTGQRMVGSSLSLSFIHSFFLSICLPIGLLVSWPVYLSHGGNGKMWPMSFFTSC